MHFINTAAFALLAVSANAQLRTLTGYIGSDTGCGGGNSLSCGPVAQSFCCFLDGTSFGSARIDNPNADREDEVNGALPVAGTSGDNCGPIVVTGRGGDCINSGPSGFSGFGWRRLSPGNKRRAEDATESANGTEYRHLTFADGITFDILSLTPEEEKEIAAVARSSTSSVNVPSNLWKAQI